VVGVPQQLGDHEALARDEFCSVAQLPTLTEIGEERTANAGKLVSRAGDRDYAFAAIIGGQVAVLDAAGKRDRTARRLEVPRRG
jgi:hypothetical protein